NLPVSPPPCKIRNSKRQFRTRMARSNFSVPSAAALPEDDTEVSASWAAARQPPNARSSVAFVVLVELGHDAGDALADDVFDEGPERFFVFGLGHQTERYAEATHVGATAAVRATLAVVAEGILHERRGIDRSAASA